MLASTIDQIEQAKRIHYQQTGQHLSILPQRNRVTMVITDRPIAPIMLPIAKHGYKDRVLDAVKSKRIKVTVKK